jgi:hypothetical protein
MAARSIADLAEKLLALTPIEFESFVFDLVRRLPGARDVGRNLRIGGTEIDVQATLDGQVTVFEAKRLATLSTSQVATITAFARRAQELAGAERAILVMPGRLSSELLELFQNNNVTFWGIEDLANRTTDDLWKWLEAAGRDVPVDFIPRKAASLSAALDAIPPGIQDANDFQKLWLDAAEFLFTPPLGVPQYEVNDEENRNRRDIIIENFAETGFWAVARAEYAARYIVIDAKNYTGPIGKRCVLDVAHYLKRHGCGLFALLATRVGQKKSARHAIREHWIAEKKLILVLDDNDLKRMLDLRSDGADPSVIIRERLRIFIFSM